MTTLRRFLQRHAALAAMIVAAALALRVLVPAGFMPTIADGRIVIAICSGHGPATIALPGTALPDGSAPKAESRCAFADLALPAIAGADPVQLAAALRHILAAGLILTLALAPRPRAYLRPPLRGPPRTS